jgi:glycosyltransferase involved in cell wall biosynthesis
MNPLVSVVIPTRNRPDLACRAVRSALKQSDANLQVVVVVDGPDPATVEALKALDKARVRIVALTENVGGCEARNIGVGEAQGDWIALLDDDDEWLEKKIQRQMGLILAADAEVLFSATQYIDKQDGRSCIQPSRFPTPQGHISEYLFCEMSVLGRRTTFLQTSTWMVPRRFLITHPFSRGLKRNQDTDWLLRSFPDCSNKTVFVSEPLAIFHSQPGLTRISTTQDWEYSFQWAERNASLFTRRAHAFFLMTVCARAAAIQGSGLNAVASLWRKCDRPYKRSPGLMLCLVKRLAQCLVHSVRQKKVAPRPYMRKEPQV